MEHSFHYMLMAIQALVQKKLLAELKSTGLTAGQPKVLDYLRDHNGANQKEIAQGCHIEAGSLTSLLNRMEENSLVQRRMLNGNRRTYYIFLTEEGQVLSDIVSQKFEEIEKQIFQNIPSGDKEHFTKVFSDIYESLLPKEE